MDFSFSFSLQPWGTLFLALLGGWFWIRASRRHQARGGAAPAGPAVKTLPEGPGVAGDENHQFHSGNTQGVAWSAEVLHLAREVDDGLANRRVNDRSHTRWTGVGCPAPGAPLMLMSLPDGVVAPSPASQGQGGWFSALADKAGEVALKVYLTQRFGGERIQGLDLQPAQRLDLGDGPFGQKYAAWCGHPEGGAHLTEAVRSWFLAEHGGEVAMLWDHQGLTVYWPEAHLSREWADRCAERGAALVLLLNPPPAASE